MRAAIVPRPKAPQPQYTGGIMQASKELFRQYLGSTYRKLMSFQQYLTFIGEEK